MRIARHLIIAFIISCLTASCTAFWHDLMTGNSRQDVSSSPVDFLYPKVEVPTDYDQTVPNLLLPLRVGLAFAPSRVNNVEGLSEANKAVLLEEVKKSFANREFLKEIVIIPDTCMRSGQSCARRSLRQAVT